MTGYGEAQHQQSGVSASIEVRSINSRYFKLTIRAGDTFGSFETRIESLVRHFIRRGSVQLVVRVERDSSDDDYQINRAVVHSYLRQLRELAESTELSATLDLAALLGLPGVVDEKLAMRPVDESEWPVVETTLKRALANLNEMRKTEGLAMADDLLTQCRQIAEELASINDRAPMVVDAYRGRLTERLNSLLAEYETSVTSADVVKEVGIFAERSDISEEIVRLRSHLGQFESTMTMTESPGRRLEFLVQEMFREVNTIGAKANDATISGHVIEIKAAIERIREMIQNVE